MDTVLPYPTHSKSKFLNWIKAALAVLITKEEVEPVVYDEIEQFQQKCLHYIATSKKLPAGSTCSNCRTENVVSCPTNNICNIYHGKCRYHKNSSTQYRPSGCPNKICDNLKSEIQNSHRFNHPSYRNSDAKQWCNNPWEVAKCYMPDGYKDVTNAADTDFNGINSVIINYRGFGAKICDDLSQGKNIFEEGREVGRAVRHSPNLEVEDTDLAKYFNILNNILSHPGFVVINKSPHNARIKLAQLQNDELVIGKDVLSTVLNDTENAIQENMRNEMRMYKEETEERKLELLEVVKTKVKCIEDQGIISLKQINEALESSIDTLDSKLQEINKQGEQIRQNIDKVGADNFQKVNEVRKQALREIQEVTKDESNKEKKGHTSIWQRFFQWIRYRRMKKELKKQLVEFYKNNRSTVSLSPLFEEKDTPLVEFYVMPDMVIVNQTSHTSHQEERIPVKSLTDLFITESENQQEIYLSAHAGFGKTSFSKYLAITWSQACCPDKYQNSFTPEELKALANFEFVFLVLLRDCKAVCNIDEMIEHQIIKKLPPSLSQCPLHEVLEREKCLVILDGLDEWTHPDNGCTEQEEKIPHRYSRDNCVILTTTRPWKLGVSNLKTSDINKKVELVQFSEDSTRQLEKNAIRKMSGVNDDDELKRKTQEFDKVIEDRGFGNMQTIPLLLLYITCLWCNKIPIGNSKLEVYINIIEFLLSRTAHKHQVVLPSSEPSHGDIPEYFKTHAFCEKFYSLLTALAKLAFHTIFNEKRENTLVFNVSVVEKYLKADDMKLSLLSGILTESATATLIERKSKVSFSHKTVQEFFAAIFISSQSDAQKTVVEKCKNVQSILDMSTICEFLSKINSKMMCEISTDLMSVINEDEETCEHRTRTDVYSKPLYSIQKMLLSCFKEMPESENIKLCLQDFFIGDDTIHDKQLPRLLKQNKTNIKSLYIYSNSASGSLREIIKLFPLTDLNNLQKLYYEGDDDDAEEEISCLLFGTHQQIETDYKYPMFASVQLTIVNKNTDSIALWKVPLKYLPRLCQSHKYVDNLTGYCKKLENELALPPMETRGTEKQQDIDIFIQDKAFDVQQLVKEDVVFKPVNTKINGIAWERKDISRRKALGLFVNSKSVQIVDSVSNNIISVYYDPNIKSYVEQENTINLVISLIEVIIFMPLFDKIKLLNELRNISLTSGKEDRKFTAASIVKEFQYLYPNTQDIAYEGDLNGCIQQNKRQIDKMLGEMVALINRSNLPKGILPELKRYQTKDISKEVAEGLFQLDKDIKWCGYRYDTLHVYVQKGCNTTVKDSIATFLASNGITNFKLVYIDGELKQYSYVGSKIHNSDKIHYATLGCFAKFKSGNNSTTCGLISRHFTYFGDEIYDKDKTPLGTVILETKDKGCYDIAAAKIKSERVSKLDTKFRNYNGDNKPAELIQIVDNLQNQPVYLRGASTTIGVGTIEIPNLEQKYGKPLMKVSPGSYTLGNPNGKLAEPGDSGAILCLDDLSQNICICSMFMGEIICETEGGDFCFLPLSSGLEQLNETTNGEFELLN